MKWIACYVVGGMLLITPIGVRFLTHSQPGSTEYAASAADAGKELFIHKWEPHDGKSPNGDGVGPVFNAFSCAECHIQGQGPQAVGGSGNTDHNVTTFFRPSPTGVGGQSGVIHARATDEKYQEYLDLVGEGLPHTSQPNLQQIQDSLTRASTGIRLSQRNTPALFGVALVDAIPDDVILAQERAQKLRWHELTGMTDKVPVGRALHVQGGAIGKFGWKAQNASLFEFVQAACANELGLGNPGQAQPKSLRDVSYMAPGFDLTNEQCMQITAFVASLPRPVEIPPANPAEREQAHQGRDLFSKVGCAECHTPNMGSVEGVYSDLLVHRMGADLVGSAGYYVPREDIPDSPGDDPLPDEWRTPPLWGVADSGPYLHDGRAVTLQDAIRAHGGQGVMSRDNFNQLNMSQQAALVEFLKSLRAPG